jgi:hypothetical protein
VKSDVGARREFSTVPVESPAEEPAAAFVIAETHSALQHAPEFQRESWSHKVQKLQNLLQRVERYRARVAIRDRAW